MTISFLLDKNKAIKHSTISSIKQQQQQSLHRQQPINKSSNNGNLMTVEADYYIDDDKYDNQLKNLPKTTNNDKSMMAATGSEGSRRINNLNGCDMIAGQKWQIISFNNAPVLSALLGEVGSDDNCQEDYSIIHNDDSSQMLNSDQEYHMSFQEAVRSSVSSEHLVGTSSSPPPLEHPKQSLVQAENSQKKIRSRKKTIPPTDYICKLCNHSGHWMEDCLLYRPHTIVLNPDNRSDIMIPPPPSNYLCRLCSIPGHWIDQCSKFTPKSTIQCKHNSNISTYNQRIHSPNRSFKGR